MLQSPNPPTFPEFLTTFPIVTNDVNNIITNFYYNWAPLKTPAGLIYGNL